MPKTIDRKLIKGCLDDNRRSQNELYRKLFSFLMNICMRYKNNYDDAGSALNAIFLKLMLALSDYDVNKPILPWVKTIAIRHLIDEFRSKAVLNEVSLEEIADQHIYFAQPDEQLRADDILKLIHLLPEPSKAVFNLHVIDGYTHREIGDELHILESTSRWHLAKARKQLQGWLNREETKALKSKAV